MDTTNNDIPQSAASTGLFPNGLTQTNHRLGLIKLLSPLPLPSFPTDDFLPAVGTIVPTALRHIASITGTNQATIMWANPLIVGRPDYRYYHNIGFFQLTNGRWLIFDKLTGRRINFKIVYIKKPDVEDLQGLGSLDVEQMLRELKQRGERMQAPPTVAPSKIRLCNPAGGMAHIGQVGPSHTLATLEPPLRRQEAPENTISAPTQFMHQPTSNVILQRNADMDIPALYTASQLSSHDQATTLQTQALPRRQLDRFDGPTATHCNDVLDFPLTTGPPPRHPTNPRKRLRKERYLYPMDHDFYFLNFPLAGTDDKEDDFYEDVSDAENEREGLDCAPMTFADQSRLFPTGAATKMKSNGVYKPLPAAHFALPTVYYTDTPTFQPSTEEQKLSKELGDKGRLFTAGAVKRTQWPEWMERNLAASAQKAKAAEALTAMAAEDLADTTTTASLFDNKAWMTQPPSCYPPATIPSGTQPKTKKIRKRGKQPLMKEKRPLINGKRPYRKKDASYWATRYPYNLTNVAQMKVDAANEPLGALTSPTVEAQVDEQPTIGQGVEPQLEESAPASTLADEDNNGAYLGENPRDVEPIGSSAESTATDTATPVSADEPSTPPSACVSDTWMPYVPTEDELLQEEFDEAGRSSTSE